MQNFYLDIRKTLLHPWCVQPEDGDETTEKIESKTYEKFHEEPSAKLIMLIGIVLHHLASDGVLGYGSCEPEPPQQQQSQQQKLGPVLGPDKIVIHSCFPSSFWLIKLVSDWLSKI